MPGLVLSQLESGKGAYIWLLVLQLAGAVVAFVTRSALSRDPKTGRIPVLVYTAVFTAALWLTYLVADRIRVSSYSVDEAVLMIGPAAVGLMPTGAAAGERGRLNSRTSPT